MATILRSAHFRPVRRPGGTTSQKEIICLPQIVRSGNEETVVVGALLEFCDEGHASLINPGNCGL